MRPGGPAPRNEEGRTFRTDRNGADMNAPYYLSESSWRSEMLAAQAATRHAIRELAFLIAALFLAYARSAYWPGLAVAIGAIMCAGTIYTIWADNRSQARFEEAMSAMPELER